MALRLGLLIFAVLALWTNPAHAAFTVESWGDCSGGYNSGSYDDAGDLYVVCGNPSTMHVYAATGELESYAYLDVRYTDVAPSPDGAHAYVTGPRDEPRRLNRQPDGSWVLDPDWRLANFSLYGESWAARGLFIDTDSAGNIYLSDGAFAEEPNHSVPPHTVVKYTASGALVTRFGEWANSRALGTFYHALNGVVAAGDGTNVYTIENGNNRIQKWVWDAGQSKYVASAEYGGNAANDPGRGGDCAFDGVWSGAFAAPYDLGIDAAGNFLVVNTTCHEVIKLTSALAFAEAVQVGSESVVMETWPNGDVKRPHGIAVAANGNACIGQSHARIRAAGNESSCVGTPPARSTGGATTTPPGTGPVTGTGDGGSGDAGTPPPAADTTPPNVVARAAARQRLARRRGARLSVACDEACSLSIGGRVRIGRASFRFTPRSRSISAGSTVRLQLVLPARAVSAVRRALARRKRVIATVEVRARDGAWNAAPLRRLSVRAVR